MRTIYSVLIVCLASLAFSQSALSATWNYSGVGNDDANYFFDQDTVAKTGDTVMVWMKSVQTRNLDTDGSWATAYKWRINCAKRTMQTLTASAYEKNGKFINSLSTPGREEEVIPDSLGEGILKIACEADFPKNKPGKKYLPVADNDIFAATRRYVEWSDSRKNQAPK